MQIDLTPATYQLAQTRAQAEGYDSVSELISDLLIYAVDDDVILPHPALTAEIQKGIDDIEAGRTMTWEAAMQELKRFTSEFPNE